MLNLNTNDPRISWSKPNNIFSCEASDIGWRGQPVRLTNPRTGGWRIFNHEETVRDREGDTTSWILASPEGIKLEILND